MSPITAAARKLLESISAGRVTGSFSSHPNSWYRDAVPAIDGLFLAAFQEYDPGRERSYSVSSPVCALVAAGLVAAEAGEFVEAPAAEDRGHLVAADANPVRHMRAPVVLTDAGRAALGLEAASGTPAAPDGDGRQ